MYAGRSKVSSGRRWGGEAYAREGDIGDPTWCREVANFLRGSFSCDIALCM